MTVPTLVTKDALLIPFTTTLSTSTRYASRGVIKSILQLSLLATLFNLTRLDGIVAREIHVQAPADDGSLHWAVFV